MQSGFFINTDEGVVRSNSNTLNNNNLSWRLLMSNIIYHNHHIIPKYRCKEIGIDPDFPENIIRLTRTEHSAAHYHRWIKFGRYEDLWAVSIISKGEMDGLDTSGDKNPFYGKKHSAESRKKMSDASSGEKNYFYGKSLSEDHKKKISESKKGEKNCWYGKSFSEEHKRKIGDAQKGVPQPKTTCPHCLKTGGESNMKRYHFDNCKEISTIF